MTRTVVAVAVAAFVLGGVVAAGVELLWRQDQAPVAPPWVLGLAKEDAADMGEPDPEITFAACGPLTCIVRMHGSFVCHGCSHPPSVDAPRGSRVDLEVNLQSRVIETREVYASA